MGTPTGPLGRRYDHGGGEVRGGPENQQGLSREPVVFSNQFAWRFSRPVRSGWERSGRPNQVRKNRRNRHAEGIRSTGRNPGRVGTSATSAVHASQLIATASARGNG